ncbi:DUF2752 domain-containing protein [Flavobacterium branchiophilum]|uniref:DUF2752 domain-containing protein n=3 Tax=Flavobacterium branchiophilum TaxID=55197 RepID=G2Z0A4_FLABF|nr:DUF2752 domain-containing protein [Flavobacterium branchiophilum]TQM40148.1 uncharacterized protein DUF2752 [Flavobacterium branchiophilum]GEM54925.1 hypothetical protein FB1_11460 [Flavobacterium branchiophilum NBRC 15030 = ATCC 35035]CCB70762.1 Hypothetical protein FBFL15_2772 [Flavobacterium branchiophilum FL-15]
MVPYIIMWLNQGSDLANKQSYCPLKMLTGFPCPGCGITKSLVCFYQGNVWQSLEYHLFGPFAILFCIIAIVTLTTELITGKSYFDTYFYNKKIAVIMAYTLGIYHIIRLIIFVQQHNMESILEQSIWK